MNTGNTPPVMQQDTQRIAHYRIVRKLGQGGMSAVYEGFDERLKRPVAIKVLHPFLADTSEYRARFFREAQVVACLDHKNIVRIYDVVNPKVDSDELYIVTELLMGETLDAFMKRLPFYELPELAAMVIRQVAYALTHAHEKGIVHRDIKPENIMIGGDGNIKLMDFGIASIGGEESLTQANTLMGSFAHLAPEVIRGNKATAQSDIYSLSTVFFLLLTKKLPFVGDSAHALLKAIVDAPHEKVQCLSPYISDDLADIVDRGMAKEPKNRFMTARSMSDSIDDALTRMGIRVDEKELALVLGKPLEKFERFKSLVNGQIKKQLLGYQKAHKNTLALALTCRLEADKKETAKRPPHFTDRKRIYFYSVLLSSMALSVFFLMRAMESLPPIEKAAHLNVTSHDQKLVTMFQPQSLMMGEAEPLEDKPPDTEAAPHERSNKEHGEKKATFKQRVNIYIWPFADVLVDGKKVAIERKSLSLSLRPGVHRLSFTHTYAATVEKVIEVRRTSEPLVLNVALIKSKPAFLVVKSNIDCDVSIDGNFRGSADRSVDHPIVVSMPDRTHAHHKEIILSRDGFVPMIKRIEFIAGQKKEIGVELERLD